MSIMIIVSIIISVIIILGTFFLNKCAPTSPHGGAWAEKLSQYECGFEPIEEKPGIETRERYFIKFHIVAVIFLIFDLEAILLYPFTTIMYNNLSIGLDFFLPLCVFFLFMSFLILGLVYEYKKGVLS